MIAPLEGAAWLQFLWRAARQPRPMRSMKRTARPTETALKAVPAQCVVLRSYTAAECTSDAVVHALGVLWGVLAACTAVARVRRSRNVGTGSVREVKTASRPPRRAGREVQAMLAYAVGFVGMLCCSAAYNIAWSAHHLDMQSVGWWVHPPAPDVVAWLRQLDRTWIYVCIASTYTALSTRVPGKGSLMVCIWTTAGIGVILKTLVAFGKPLFSEEVFSGLETLTLLLYVALGWVPVPSMWVVARKLQPFAKRCIICSGVCYTVGVYFYLSAYMPFHNFIWHVMVLLATILMYRGVTSDANTEVSNATMKASKSWLFSTPLKEDLYNLLLAAKWCPRRRTLMHGT